MNYHCKLFNIELCRACNKGNLGKCFIEFYIKHLNSQKSLYLKMEEACRLYSVRLNFGYSEYFICALKILNLLEKVIILSLLH